MRVRTILTPASRALTIGHVSAVISVELPAGFYALNREERRRMLADAMTEALDDAAESAERAAA